MSNKDELKIQLSSMYGEFLETASENELSELNTFMNTKLKNITERKLFFDNLKKVSDEVDGWPEWKKGEVFNGSG